MEREDISREHKKRITHQTASLDIVSLQEALDRTLNNLQRFIQHAPDGVDRHKPALPDSAHGKNLT
jgi:hypothetical protein